jgi:hypothetical protein
MAECETCRHGVTGEDSYTAPHTDGTERVFCKDCGRIVSDPIVWAGGRRHGYPGTHEDERERLRQHLYEGDRLLGQVRSIAETAIKRGLLTAEDLHRAIDHVLNAMAEEDASS